MARIHRSDYLLNNYIVSYLNSFLKSIYIVYDQQRFLPIIIVVHYYYAPSGSTLNSSFLYCYLWLWS